MRARASILCNGCPESRIDSARIENFFRENEWNIISDFRKADLVLFRACGLDEFCAKNSMDVIRRINAGKNVGSRLIVWGCLPKIDPELLKTEYNDITFGEREINIMNEIIKADRKIHEIDANFLVPSYRPNSFLRIQSKTFEYVSSLYGIAPPFLSVYYIKVATGCLGRCTYCAIRKSRGILRSINVDKILYEFKKGLKKGYKYFGLLATELGAYGLDKGKNLVDLLNELMNVKGDFKIGLRNINPYYLNMMFEDLKPFFKSGKIWYLMSPVESGSNKILNLMGRKYEVEDFKKCIKHINKNYGEILLRTQMMVGFPNETERDFLRSMQLIEELTFDWVEVYKYSKRPGTLASKMSGQLPAKIKRLRYSKMLKKSLLQNPKRKISYFENFAREAIHMRGLRGKA